MGFAAGFSSREDSGFFAGSLATGGFPLCCVLAGVGGGIRGPAVPVARRRALGVEGVEEVPPLAVHRVAVLLELLVELVNKPLVSAEFFR